MDEVIIKIFRESADIGLPRYAYPGDAGMDLESAADIDVAPFERALVPTGLKMEIPEGYAGYIQPRSGISMKTGLTVINTPGLIDSRYRGEIKIPMINLDPHMVVNITKGDRIAQIVFLNVPHVHIEEVSALDRTERGTGGFGSSGV